MKQPTVFHIQYDTMLFEKGSNLKFQENTGNSLGLLGLPIIISLSKNSQVDKFYRPQTVLQLWNCYLCVYASPVRYGNLCHLELHQNILCILMCSVMKCWLFFDNLEDEHSALYTINILILILTPFHKGLDCMCIYIHTQYLPEYKHSDTIIVEQVKLMLGLMGW